VRPGHGGDDAPQRPRQACSVEGVPDDACVAVGVAERALPPEVEVQGDVLVGRVVLDERLGALQDLDGLRELGMRRDDVGGPSAPARSSVVKVWPSRVIALTARTSCSR